MMKKSTQPLVRFASASLIAACSLLPLSTVLQKKPVILLLQQQLLKRLQTQVLLLRLQSLQRVKLLKPLWSRSSLA